MGKAEAYFKAGEQAFKDENYKEAIKQYSKSVDIYKGLNGDYGSEIGALYYVIGESYVEVTDYKTAISYFEKSLLIYEKISGEKELVFATYSYLAVMYVKSNDSDLEKALEYGKKAEDFAQSHFGATSTQMAEANKNLGEIYCDMGLFDQANTHWAEAIKLYGEKSKECAKIYLQMSRMYEIQEKYEEEEQILKKALTIFEENDAWGWMGDIYSELASFYGNRNEHNTAIANYKLALEAYNKGGISGISESICHYNMGYEYFCIGDLNNFQEEMRKAYIVSQEIGVDTELVEIATTRVKENMIIYYDEYYEGDKTSGFDAWFEEFISQ